MSLNPVRLEVVSILLVDHIQQQQVWLAKRTDPKSGYFGCFATPGGMIEKGEYPVRAAQRELFEEAGLTIEPERFHSYGLTVHKDQKQRQFWLYSFYVFLREGEVPVWKEKDKQGPWIRFGRDNLPILLTPGTWTILTGKSS